MNHSHQAIHYLKPEHLAPIRSLALRGRLIVEGLIAGLHRSPFHGFSSEFLQYRSYYHGEPARSIDWRKFAKSDRSVVRLFEDETNLYARILVDTSASMQFNSGMTLNKYEYSITLAAALAWILIRQRDAVGLCMFDNTVIHNLSPKSSNLQLKIILNTLEHTNVGKATNCSAAINTIAQTITKRGLCILLSDLFDDHISLVNGLRHLRFKKQDVMILWILDPREICFSSPASPVIKDLETGKELTLDSEIASTFWKRGMEAHKNYILSACREYGIDINIISTDEPFSHALLRILEKRRRLY